MVMPRNGGSGGPSEGLMGSPPRRNNLNARHNSFDNLTPVKPNSSRTPNARFQSNRRARELEQHLKDKYGLPDNDRNLRRANSHNSLSQFSPSTLLRPSATSAAPSSNNKTLIRRKSTGVEPMSAMAKSPVKNLTDISATNVNHREARDSKLRYLGRMSPEEQVDKYLRSVEKEARLRQKLRQKAEALEGHTDYRTTFDPSRHLSNETNKRVNTSMTSSRWHSLDSVSRPVLAKGVKNNIVNRNNRKSQSPTDHGKKPLTRLVNPRGKPPGAVVDVRGHGHGGPVGGVVGGRERTDLPKSFVSMPQINHEPFVSSGASSSVSDIRKSPEEKMSTGSDHHSQSVATTANAHQRGNHFEEDSHSDDFVDSCSCTDVTLDENVQINHNHRKSLARKKKLQSQRLKELNKLDNGNPNPNIDNNSHAIKVSYLGSITLDSKSNDLLALQKPLKSLYFKYVIAQQAGLDPVQGHLQITKTGLKVRTTYAYTTFYLASFSYS